MTWAQVAFVDHRIAIASRDALPRTALPLIVGLCRVTRCQASLFAFVVFFGERLVAEYVPELCQEEAEQRGWQAQRRAENDSDISEGHFVDIGMVHNEYQMSGEKAKDVIISSGQMCY